MNGSSPRNGVHIEIKRENISIYNISEEASQTSTTIISLAPFTTYSISVYVMSLLGRSLPSTINASTLSLSKTIRVGLIYNTVLTKYLTLYMSSKSLNVI